MVAEVIGAISVIGRSAGTNWKELVSAGRGIRLAGQGFQAANSFSTRGMYSLADVALRF